MSLEMPSAPETLDMPSAQETNFDPNICEESPPKRAFYFCPEDEESVGLREKLEAFGEVVLETLPSSETESSSLIVISKYQNYQNYPQTYSPFYLARMIDVNIRDKRTHLLLGPCDCALDKPCPVSGVEPKLLFTLSGFKGEERAKLQVMITLMGSRYSDYLTPATNVLIAKKGARTSPKMLAAVNWSIQIRCEDWLELCFKAWTWLPINES